MSETEIIEEEYVPEPAGPKTALVSIVGRPSVAVVEPGNDSPDPGAADVRRFGGFHSG